MNKVIATILLCATVASAQNPISKCACKGRWSVLPSTGGLMYLTNGRTQASDDFSEDYAVDNGSDQVCGQVTTDFSGNRFYATFHFTRLSTEFITKKGAEKFVEAVCDNGENINVKWDAASAQWKVIPFSNNIFLTSGPTSTATSATK